MVSTKKRKKNSKSEEAASGEENSERVNCNACGADVTFAVRLTCVDPGCPDVDMCPRCFCEGKAPDGHEPWHAYRVEDKHSYPIYAEDWGADEELLMMAGLLHSGLGNWQGVSDDMFACRTKEEIEKHYVGLYLNAPNHLPQRRTFTVPKEVFDANKRRRLKEMTDAPLPPLPGKPPTSVPATHEVTGYMPGRLEFEAEPEYNAELPVADLEFGIVLQYGGDEQPEDPTAMQVDAAVKTEEKAGTFSAVVDADGDEDMDADGEAEDGEPPLVVEPRWDEEANEMQVKLTILEGYNHRLQKRQLIKAVVFDRNLLDYRKVQGAERRRPKEEKEVYGKYKPFARLQTAEDYEAFIDGLNYEAGLKKRISELQEIRRAGLTSVNDVAQWEADKKTRHANKDKLERNYSQKQGVPGYTRGSLPPGGLERGSMPPRGSREPSATPAAPVRIRKPAPPLNLANAQSLHLLTKAEQVLCSQLRILPKPFLAIKESLVREYARRNGKMSRRDARAVLKIDVNKVGTIWDYFEKAGFFKKQDEFVIAAANGAAGQPSGLNGSHANGATATKSPAKAAGAMASKAPGSGASRPPASKAPASRPAQKTPVPSAKPAGPPLSKPGISSPLKQPPAFPANALAGPSKSIKALPSKPPSSVPLPGKPISALPARPPSTLPAKPGSAISSSATPAFLTKAPPSSSRPKPPGSAPSTKPPGSALATKPPGGVPLKPAIQPKPNILPNPGLPRSVPRPPAPP